MKTLPELEAMSDDELRVMLAEIQGWNFWNDGAETMLWRGEKAPHRVFVKGDGRPKAPIVCIGLDIPNYPSDLNACHEVETQYSMHIGNKIESIAHDYCMALHGSSSGHNQFHCATARQRTIALILTLQKP